MGFQSRDLTDILLADAEAMIESLCEQNQAEVGRYEFTSQQFIKLAAQRNQDAYVRLLERSRVHYPDSIINSAHEAIGLALYWRATKLGFEKHDEGNSETDIFDNPTRRITYRPVL